MRMELSYIYMCEYEAFYVRICISHTHDIPNKMLLFILQLSHVFLLLSHRAYSLSFIHSFISSSLFPLLLIFLSLPLFVSFICLYAFKTPNVWHITAHLVLFAMKCFVLVQIVPILLPFAVLNYDVHEF